MNMAQAGTRLVALLTLEYALRGNHALGRPQVTGVSAGGALRDVILVAMRVLRAR